MNATLRTIRRSHTAALDAAKALAYRTLSGLIATLVDQGRLIRTGDVLDRLGADLPDGQASWYGRHAVKAYRKREGAEPLKVWAQHRTTGRYVHVYVYAPNDPALYEALRTYKATRHLTTQAQFTEAA